jgi:hypothetical protein
MAARSFRPLPTAKPDFSLAHPSERQEACLYRLRSQCLRAISEPGRVPALGAGCRSCIIARYSTGSGAAMRMVQAGVAMLLFLLFTASNFSAFGQQTENFEDTGAALKQRCIGVQGALASSTSNGICMGFITGVASAMSVTGNFCWPDGAMGAQFVAVVMKYLDDHPELLHKRDLLLVHQALTQAFPCPAQK